MDNKKKALKNGSKLPYITNAIFVLKTFRPLMASGIRADEEVRGFAFRAPRPNSDPDNRNSKLLPPLGYFVLHQKRIGGRPLVWTVSHRECGFELKMDEPEAIQAYQKALFVIGEHYEEILEKVDEFRAKDRATQSVES